MLSFFRSKGGYCMIRIAIVDDEPIIANNIAKMTKIHADKLNIAVLITTYSNSRNFLDNYHVGDYDVIFLILICRNLAEICCRQNL